MVIAIIAILAGMLLPALGKVKARGNSVACYGNLKSITQASTMYSDTWDGWIVKSDADRGNGMHIWWRNLLASFVGIPGEVFKADGTLNSSITEKVSRTDGIFFCPGANTPDALYQASGLFVRGNPLKVKFDAGCDALRNELLNNGWEHHFSMTYGDLTEELLALGRAWDIETTVIR